MDIPHVVNPAKFEQKDLILLHGAYKCMQRKVQGTCDKRRCHATRCQDMRSVVKHMMSCPSERLCSWPVSCSSLRQEVKRLTSCKEPYCPICIQKKEWQVSVSAEQRSNLVDLLLQNTSSSDPMHLHCKVLQAQNMERATYNEADNLTDYYRMLAAKKWETEMDSKDKSKLQIRLQANMNIQANMFERRRMRMGRRDRHVNARYYERLHGVYIDE